MAGFRIEDVHAGDVCWHEVRGALDSLEAAADGGSEAPAQQGFAETGSTLQENVAPADQGDRQGVYGLLGAVHDPAEFPLQMLLQFLSGHPSASRMLSM